MSYIPQKRARGSRQTSKDVAALLAQHLSSLYSPSASTFVENNVNATSPNNDYEDSFFDFETFEATEATEATEENESNETGTLDDGK